VIDARTREMLQTPRDHEIWRRAFSAGRRQQELELRHEMEQLFFELVSQADRPVRISEIHSAAEDAFRTPISASTIKDAMSRMAADWDSPVVRVGRGLYGIRLNRDTSGRKR
jgi:hypothetical protein